MKLRTIRSAVFAASALSLVALAGCELIVDFDRTKIPVDAPEAGTPTEGGIPDSSIPDVQQPVDAADAGIDTGLTDAGQDAPTDG